MNLKNISSSPGVYLFKDKDNNIIYIGKAKNLSKRINQYFHGSINSYKTSKMVTKIYNFKTIITNTEIESLILERNLIDKYKPFYNILLLDDKKYPYIKLTIKKNVLNISVQFIYKKESNSYYFGPFPIGQGISNIIKFLERECFYENGLPIKQKDKDLLFWKSKLQYCKNILGNKQKYKKYLKQKMNFYSNNLMFELANDYKNMFVFLESNNKEIFDLKTDSNFYVIVILKNKNYLHLLVETYYYGIFLAKQFFVYEIFINEIDIIEQFLSQFFVNKKEPDFVISNYDKNKLKNYYDLKIINPKKGNKKLILDNALINLKNNLILEQLKFQKRKEIIEKGMKFLAVNSNSKNLHNFIMVDNSNFNNFYPISVFIYYDDGIKVTCNYRKFKLEENLKGDVNYLEEGLLKYFNNKNNLLADLLIVDGGIAQLNKAIKVLNYLKVDLPVVALVKNEFHKTDSIINYKKEIIKIIDNDILLFLSEIQIEVDRYAKVNYRKIKRISSLEGSLLKIDGIGIITEKRILDCFKTYASVYNASYEELIKVVSPKIALDIKKEFRQKR